MDEEEPTPGFDALNDWYEKALQEGKGFQSEEERQEYLKSIGDPLKHPMFAQSTEDLIGNPLADGLRMLREEDKTFVELALMYKDDGNELFKRGGKPDFIEAGNKYTHALTFVDQAEAARENHTEDAKDASCDLRNLRSQILSNRAMASLSIKNYGSCRKDAELAIQFCPTNKKAHYRRCKALQALRYFEECRSACGEGLAADPDNKDIIAIQNQCEAELMKTSQRREEETRVIVRREEEWGRIWDAVKAGEARLRIQSSERQDGPLSALSRSINLGFLVGQQPEQLKEVYPYMDEDLTLRCPLLFLYPQYSQLDVVPHAGVSDMLAEHLAVMFPEFDDGAEPLPWDEKREYHVSNLVVYVPLNAAPTISSRGNWIESCREQRSLQGLDGPSAQEAASQALRGRLEQHQASVKRRAEAASKTKGQDSGGGAGKTQGKGKGGIDEAKTRYVEVHLGCALGQVLRVRGHVLSGGVVTLLVHARASPAHTRFLEHASEAPYGDNIPLLLPDGTASSSK